MTRLIQASELQFVKETVYCQIEPNEKRPMIINFGTYQFTIGFPGQKVLQTMSVIAKPKPGEPVRVGNDLSVQEITKSGRFACQDGLLLYSDVLKDLLEAWFIRILPQEARAQRTFPYTVYFVISRAQPRLSQDYVYDVFANYFNCAHFSFLYTEDLVQHANTVLINFGHSDTTVSCENRQQSLTYGSLHATLLIQQHLQAKYKFFQKNVGFELADCIKQLCCSYRPYFTPQQPNNDDSAFDFERAYREHYQHIKTQLAALRRPIELVRALDTFDGRQAFSEYYGKQLIALESHFALLQTTLPFAQLFGQEQLKNMQDFAERARGTRLQKIVNLAHYQAASELEQMDEMEQLQTLYQYSAERIKHYSQQLKMFERNRQITHLFDRAYEQVDFGDQYVDLQKVVSHLSSQFNEVNTANAMCAVKLADMGWAEHKPYAVPQIQYFYDGAASQHGNVLLPVFGEQILAQEVYFQPQLLGLQCLDLTEAVALVAPSGPFRAVCVGGGCIDGIELRLAAELQRIGCTGVEVADEWELISARVMELCAGK